MCSRCCLPFIDLATYIRAKSNERKFNSECFIYFLHAIRIHLPLTIGLTIRISYIFVGWMKQKSINDARRQYIVFGNIWPIPNRWCVGYINEPTESDRVEYPAFSYKTFENKYSLPTYYYYCSHKFESL